MEDDKKTKSTCERIADGLSILLVVALIVNIILKCCDVISQPTNDFIIGAAYLTFSVSYFLRRQKGLAITFLILAVLKLVTTFF